MTGMFFLTTECNEGMFGPDCENDCQCLAPCNRMTGDCYGQCMPGWKGSTCQQGTGKKDYSMSL